MKTFILTVFMVLSSALSIPAGAFDATFYLVRHAEKQVDGTRDPTLTPEGEERAQAIAEALKDVSFDAIYSTNFKRTLATAAPTASQANMTVQQYDPRPDALKAFSESLKMKSGTFLIVGHSNTTPVVAGILAGKELPELLDHQYDHLYKVVHQSDGKAVLTILYTEPRTP